MNTYIKKGGILTLTAEQNLSDTRQLSPLTLAFAGDAAYELMVRELLCSQGSVPVGKLHNRAVALVRASYQARGYDLLEDKLSEEERSVLKRGRNANSVHVPKNADAVEYRKATGLEALCGYLYLSGQTERLRELFHIMMENLD